MGQKADPRSLRLNIVKECENNWFSLKNYPKFLLDDYHIRKYVFDKLKKGSISKLIIKRKDQGHDILEVYSAKPGIILGKNGDELTKFREIISKKFNKKFTINILDEKKPELSSKLLTEIVIAQLEKRVPFRRAMKMVVQSALKAGAEGVQVNCAGRLGGVEIARSEWYQKGRMPKHTLRADIDYYCGEAHTIYGVIGVKLWVNKGEVTTNK